jgi:serine/threonine protein phosphatase PrpC
MKPSCKLTQDDHKTQESKQKLPPPHDSGLKSHRVIARHRAIFQSSVSPDLKPLKRPTSRLGPSDQILLKKYIHKKSSSNLIINKTLLVPKFENFSFHSIRGRTAFNPQKANQDNYILCPGLSLNTFLFGVADGHGPQGEFISHFLRSRLPSLLTSSPFFRSNLEKSMILSIQKLSVEVHHQSFDTSFSGSTLVSVVLRGNDLICANVGDSRAILASKSFDKPWKIVQISRDHKCGLPEEIARIEAKGGRVAPLKDFFGQPVGPDRVWVKSHHYPGLAMSRSIGDKVAQAVGVNALPEIFKRKLRQKDKFLVLASDGVFDVLDNLQVLDIVVAEGWNRGSPDKAAHCLAETAKEKWECIGERVDDVTCVVVFFDWE